MPPRVIKKEAETLPAVIVSNSGFTPVVGRKASCKIDHVYYEGTVKEFLRGGRLCTFHCDEDAEDVTYTIDTRLLEKPLSSNVNERFDYFRDLTKLVMHGKLKSLFVSGEGGIGKSFTLAELLSVEGFVEHGDGEMKEVIKVSKDGTEHTVKEEDYQYARVKGYTTARALFDYLHTHKDKLVIVEDCDSALTDANAQNILKAVLDTYERRRVTWLSANGNTSYDFTGSIIFLSNKNKSDVNQAIISRSVIIDLYMTPEEIIERMEYLLPSLDCAKRLTIDEKLDVLRIIDKYKFNVHDLNLRTLIKALIVYEESKNFELVRYQILNG